MVGDTPEAPLKKFQAVLCSLLSVLRHQPSFLLTLRLLQVYVVSIIDFVFEAMPPCERWLESVQVLVHRIILSSLGIHQSLPLKVLYGSAGTLGFFAPMLFGGYKLRYLKGLYNSINSRSALLRGITCHIMHTALPRPMRGDGDQARQWLAEYGLHLLPSSGPFLSPAPVQVCILRLIQGQ